MRITRKALKQPGAAPERAVRRDMNGAIQEELDAAVFLGSASAGELTATVQTCVGLWEGGLGLADVSGTDLLTRRDLGVAARAMALRGEALFRIRKTGLVPCSDWDLRTRDGRPTAYRVRISEAGGGRTETALAGAVLHFRIGADVGAPYFGSAPALLRKSRGGFNSRIQPDSWRP